MRTPLWREALGRDHRLEPLLGKGLEDNLNNSDAIDIARCRNVFSPVHTRSKAEHCNFDRQSAASNRGLLKKLTSLFLTPELAPVDLTTKLYSGETTCMETWILSSTFSLLAVHTSHKKRCLISACFTYESSSSPCACTAAVHGKYEIQGIAQSPQREWWDTGGSLIPVASETMK